MGSGYVERHLGLPARAWVSSHCPPCPGSEDVDALGNQEADAVARIWALAMHPSVVVSEWDGVLSVMLDCPWNTLTWLMQKQHVLYVLNNQRILGPSTGRELPAGEELANWLHWPLPLSEGSKHGLVCVDTASGLTQVFHGGRVNQAFRELERLSTRDRYPHWVGRDGGYISKVMKCKTGQRNMTLNEGSVSFTNCRLKCC